MEDELLEDSSSTESTKKELTPTEILDQLCPYYLDAGMTLAEYWDGDIEYVKYYRELLKRRREWQNQMLWLQGRYFYDALRAVMPALSIKTNSTSIDPYTEEPYPLTKKDANERKERAEQRQQQNMFNFMLSMTAMRNAQVERNEKKEG